MNSDSFNYISTYSRIYSYLSNYNLQVRSQGQVNITMDSHQALHFPHAHAALPIGIAGHECDIIADITRIHHRVLRYVN